jgi:hypothetical protein
MPENMTTTSGMDQIESNLCVHDCGVEHSSLSLIEEIQEELLWVAIIYHTTDYLPNTILEPYCSKNSCEFLLSLFTKN